MVTKVKGGVLDESALSGKNMTGDIAFDTSTLKIDSSNNRVGIGTASPSKKFVVSEGGAHGFEISPYDGSQNATRLINYNRNTSAYFPLEIEASQIAFEIAGTEKMRLSSSGNLGIGTTSPSSLLHLGGATNKGVEITSSTSNAGYLAVYQDQAIFSINRDGADGSFADTGKAAAVMKMHSADADSKIELQTTTSNNAEPTTRMTILKSGNVGIGDSSPTRELSLKKTTDHSIMAITTGTSTLAGIVMGDTGADDQGGVIYNNSGDYLYFRTGGAERLRILNGGGLTFNGDTAGANALDDYEEGTFTPLFYGSSSGTAENSSSGYYTKIGRQVTIHVDVYNKSFGTYSGDLRMQLPFTNAGTGIPSSAGDIYFYPSGNWDSVSNFAGIGIRCYSTSYINFALIQLDSDRQTYIGSSNTSTSNSSGNFLRFSFTYVAA